MNEGEKSRFEVNLALATLPDIWGMSILEIGTKIRTREISPIQIAGTLLLRIDAVNPVLNAYLTVRRNELLEEAERTTDRIAHGNYLGPLDGIPIAVKDNISIKGVRCTMGSKILAENIADHDATVVSKIKKSGALISGTTNLHEFASGVTNVNPFYGACKNPWNTQKITGGSSGGSAAAVSAMIAYGALGSDTSGSVRIPAALCGVVGLKPTYGLVSKYSVFPLSYSLDHVGILSRSVFDAALILQVISGQDPLDETTSNTPQEENYARRINEPIGKLTVGIPKNYFFDILDKEMRDSFLRFSDRLSAMGVSVKQVEIENLSILKDTWATIRLSEASAIHSEWLKSRPQDYGADVLKMLKLGTTYSAIDYINSQRSKRKIKDGFLAALEQCDAIITPATPIAAPSIGTNEVNLEGKIYDVYTILSRLTISSNVTGLPALVIPCELSSRGLPLSVQIIGSDFDEVGILRLGHYYEKEYGRFQSPQIA